MKKKRFFITFSILGCLFLIFVNLISSSPSSNVLGSRKCPPYHHSMIYDISPLMQAFRGARKEIKCIKNELTKDDYNSTFLLGFQDGRMFALPLGYAGQNPESQIPGYPENKQFFRASLLAVYPNLREGFPFFHESDRGMYSDQYIMINFGVRNEKGIANRQRPNYSSIKDFERSVMFAKQKALKNEWAEINVMGFEGFQTFDGFSAHKQEEGTILLLSCTRHYGGMKPESCQLSFIDHKNSLFFIIAFAKQHLENWKDIKTKAVKLVEDLEIK